MSDDNNKKVDAKSIIDLLRNIRESTEKSAKERLDFSKIDKDTISSLHSTDSGLIYRYISALALIQENSIHYIADLNNAIDNLPDRKEFEAVKSAMTKTQQTAHKSMELMEKAFNDIKESQKKGEEIYG